MGEAQDIVPATAIVQAESEVKKMLDVINRMQTQTKKFLVEGGPEIKEKISSYEKITDNMQKEVTIFMCKVMERPLSEAQSMRSQAVIKIVDELESIADYLERIVIYKARLKPDFQGASDEEYMRFMEAVWKFYEMCSLNVLDSKDKIDMEEIFKHSESLRTWADDIRDKHLERIGKGEYDALSALTYSDMVVALRKIRAHAMNLAQAFRMYKDYEL